MEKIDEPLVNRQIVLGFIEKLEKFTPEERKALVDVIKLLSNPIFVA